MLNRKVLFYFLTIIILFGLLGLGLIFYQNYSRNQIRDRKYPLTGAAQNNQTTTYESGVIKGTLYGSITEVSFNQVKVEANDKKTYQASLSTSGKVAVATKEAAFSDLKVGQKATLYSKTELPVEGKVFKVDLIEVD